MEHGNKGNQRQYKDTGMIKSSGAALLAGLLMGVSAVFAGPPVAKVGEAAPGFSLEDSDGKAHSLSDFQGRYVVLEWVNFGCPFVGKHYNSGNMQSLQRLYTAKGVIWLSICSSAPGKQGFYEGEDLKEKIAEFKAAPTAYLTDPDGTVGKLYAAKTTPHMFVIDPRGTLVYDGGIDNIASTDLEDIPKAENYIKEVLDAALAGKPLPLATSRPYGCSVKYRS
jgi:hypothetical protein